MARQVERQLRGLEEHVVCDVCRRTMLKGERPEPYLAPSRERKLVCQLCAPRAQKEGWIRESGDHTPVQPPRPSERSRFLRRRRRRLPGVDPDAAPDAARVEPEPTTNGRSRAPSVEPAPRARDPRHVRAVPTSVELKLERAIQLFNRSEHPKTVSGIARSLGSPQVSAATSEPSPAEVILTVAWELSWYQYSVDLSDTNAPVREHDRGYELEQLGKRVTEWNATVDEHGRIALEDQETVSDEPPVTHSNGEPAEDDL